MNIVALESGQFLSTAQWRLSFDGLGRECKVSISFNGANYQVSGLESEPSLSWIIQESESPLEFLFDIERMEAADSFSFDISSEGRSIVTWRLEALNVDESWSAGSQEIGTGDNGPLMIFEYDSGQWSLIAKAPKSIQKRIKTESSRGQNLSRQTKVLLDSSPTGIPKMESGLVIRLLSALNQIVLQESPSGITASYLGQFETKFTGDVHIENHHRNSLMKVLQSEVRPEPLRRVVQTEVLNAQKGSRLLVVSDGSFLVSQELADLAETKDVRVELLVIGDPIVIAPLRESTSFSMAIVSEATADELLKEICLFGI